MGKQIDTEFDTIAIVDEAFEKFNETDKQRAYESLSMLLASTLDTSDGAITPETFRMCVGEVVTKVERGF